MAEETGIAWTDSIEMPISPATIETMIEIVMDHCEVGRGNAKAAVRSIIYVLSKKAPLG